MEPETSLPETSLLVASVEITERTRPAMERAILFWAETVSDATSPRRRDLIRIKRTAVAGFFQFAEKAIDEIGPEDVRAWRVMMEARHLQSTTIYNRLSFLSSFFEWAMKEPILAAWIRFNPVRLVRSKAPKPYQSRSVKSLTDSELKALHETIAGQSTDDNLVGLRDYALWLMFITSGLRRAEILNLRGCDVEYYGEGLRIRTRLKGGEYTTRLLDEPAVREALDRYLRESKHYTVLTRKEASPLWLRHDPGAEAAAKKQPLTAWSYARQMKKYAVAAGITHRFHLHQTRHTFARLVAEESNSLHETQEALGHKNANTTRLYVQQVGTKSDKFSRRIAERLQRNKTGTV